MDKLTVISEPLRCHFCKMKVNDVIKFGPLYKLGKVRAHYFCVLLSNGLIQNGSDEEGMLGFLLKDIREGLRKTKTVMCTYCGKKNASIICSGKKCPKRFHLPCGLENGSLHQFMNEFKSFCRNHRPVQSIPAKILKDALQNGTICCICYERVEVTRKAEDVLWAPCCQKTWYHRYCVQKLAHNAGYFFKCAACNDTSKFKARMERFGIYVPQQDASWERVPNAFAELLHRHDTCDAEVCKCPDGRQKDEENTIFEIVLCRSCGAQGMHVLCGGLSVNDPQWECNVCQAVVTKRRDSKLSPEAAREMKECLLKKAGKSSSELVNEAWPPPAMEDTPESIKVETTSTDEIDVDDSGKGESRESGEIIEEQEKGAAEESVIIIEEEREGEEESRELMEEQAYAEEEEKKKEEERLEIMEEQEYAEEQEKGAAEESVLKMLKEEREEEDESRELIEEQEKVEAGETLEKEIMGEEECIEEQKRNEVEESVLVIEEGEIVEEEESSQPTEEQKDAEKEEKNAEQEKGEAEESVIIIGEEESDKEEYSEKLIEEQKKEEEEELGEVMEEHEKREEEETLEDKILEEQEKAEEGETLLEQERGEEEKWEEASLVCPGKDSFLTIKSSVRRRRKRRRSFEELQNSAAGKRRKAGTTFREEQNWIEEHEEGEEDDLVVDAEPLSEKWKDIATQTEETEENFDKKDREPKERKDGDLLQEQTEEDSVEEELGEPKTSKTVDLREGDEDDNGHSHKIGGPLSRNIPPINHCSFMTPLMQTNDRGNLGWSGADPYCFGHADGSYVHFPGTAPDFDQARLSADKTKKCNPWQHRQCCICPPTALHKSNRVKHRPVMKAMKPAPLSHKISILRKALQRSSSPRHRREGLALFSQFKDIKPGPLCYKLDMFKRVLDGKELPPARHGEDRGKKPLRYGDINPGPRSYKRSVLRKAKGKVTRSELKKHLVPRKRAKPTLPVPKMSIIGMEPSTSTSSNYREGHLGMTSVVADFEDLSRGNLDRLREEHEVEVEEWDGDSEGSRRMTRRVAGGMTGGGERLKNDVSTQTNFRVRIWMMPSRCLPLRNYLQLQQEKDGGGGPS